MVMSIVSGTFADDICRTAHVFECSADLLSLECNEPISGDVVPSTENMDTDPLTCFDGFDNDCDGFIDDADLDSCDGFPEVCDGVFDDNLDGVSDTDEYNLGDPCTEGLGICASDGVLVCKEDGTGSECSALASSPKTEAYGAGNSCNDGKDNDCDGLIDLVSGIEDPDCASFEICDGIDNNLVNGIDEGYGIGDPCTVGIGVCERWCLGMRVQPFYLGVLCLSRCSRRRVHCGR